MNTSCKHLLFILLFSVSYNVMKAQGIDPSINRDAPRIIPAPPNAAALTKFSGVDVALNTGMVKHDIPLYTLTNGKLSLPISVSYSSNGIKVDEFPSLTGMSWVLNAGGVITRTLNGAKDETATRSELNLSWLPSSQNLYNYIMQNGNPAWLNSHDSEPDVFSFNFLNYSGKFVLDANLVPVMLPHSNLKIVTNFSGSTYTFTITTPEGIKCYFGGTNATEETKSENSAYSGPPHPAFIKTSFYLTKIEHPVDGVITFTYDPYEHEMDPVSVTESLTHIISSTQGCPAPCPPSGKKVTRSYVSYKSRILKKITAGETEVVFTYSNYNLLNYSALNGQNKILNNFYVAHNNKTIKSVMFGYSYYLTTSGFSNCNQCPGNTRRPFLSSVSSGPDQYFFEYHDPSQLPVIGSFSQDHWGFYNGKNNGGNFISNEGNPVFYLEATADRTIDPEKAKYGLLTKITYPTGGYNNITYDGNITSGGAAVGGLRVRSITTNDGVVSATAHTRWIYYGPRDNKNSSSGNAATPVIDRVNTNGNVCNMTLATCTYDERSSSPINNLGIYGGGIIGYEYVTESFGGPDFEDGGIEHKFKNQHHSYAYPLLNGTVFDGPMNHSATFHGSELETRRFRKDGAGLVILNHTTNTYGADPATYNVIVKGWKVSIRYDVAPGSNFSGFDIIETRYNSYWERLNNTVNVTFDQNGLNPFTVTKNYFYNNNNHLQVTKIESVDSKGDLLKSEFKYPADFTGSIFTALISRNMISTVLDQQTFNNGFLREQTQLVYKYAGINNQLLMPDLIKHSTYVNSMENFLQYDAYDNNGNPLQFEAQDGIKNSFIWDYDNELPIAEVKNARSSDIAYTSFEADGKGNWDFYGLTFTDGSCPTGKKVYALVTGAINRTGLDGSETYIISYWSQNGPKNVNSTPSIAGRTVNGWTYYEHKVNSPHGSITVSGSGSIDELRLYPQKALMSTYTYTPLVGMRTQCDINNRITYYEYDEYQRLIVVRDQDRNVIKKICYNYADQAENCNVFYNEPNSQVFIRDNCPNGQGGQVTYIIPYGTYVSTTSQQDANMQALADLLANGQAYANALGSCGGTGCTPATCIGDDKKCVNDVCETGIKVYTGYIEHPTDPNLVLCEYHYEWSDGTWSQNYYEPSPVKCI